MKNIKKLTILHSNDLHGDFLAESIDEQLVGGVSLLSGYINKTREETENVIYVIAGDMFRGSVIDSEYRGISTIEIMNALAPDVVTIGNHEVDYGIAHLLFIEKCAKFPIINANMYIKTNGARLFKPYEIIEIDGMKVLFIGIVTEDVLASAKKEGLIGTIIDTEDAAKEIGKICNAFNGIDIDFTVLLTHIGFEEDKKLAALLNPEWGVDIIIGGHSHTVLEKPEIINGIPIVQAGTGTDAIGRFDIDVDTDNNCIDSFEWQFIPITDKNCPKDYQIEEIILGYKNITDAKYGRVVSKFKHVLTHPQRNKETALGNLVADIVKDSLGLDLMMFGAGSIRKTELGPIVTFGKLTECFPYAGAVHQVNVTADQLRKMLLHVFRDEAWTGHTEFYQLSKGIKLIYSKARQEFDVATLNGKEIKGDRVYKVGIQEFHYMNFNDFLGIDIEETHINGKPRIITTSDFDVLNEHLSSHNVVDSVVEGRIIVVE
ncbi:MAG TPA: bifunctional UDP-sugar hydrolase/5'-nucleotidase [Erysipelotrichaceae bacterium]|nr:bifunctional UDP-sugar hydrolase/5'-nucleotidase [Erysipelotrichaceae bacterium]HQA85716.1 bifunctional UDP-sugar hydrolase/5'-nucleotidase [Erysipelotrichaceae bacterium]